MAPESYVPLILLDGSLCLLAVASILLGVFAVVTGHRPWTGLLRRFSGPSDVSSPEVARLDGMAVTLSGMAGLLIALQIAGLTFFTANGIRISHTAVGAAAALAIIVVLFVLDLTLIIASASVSYTARNLRQGRSSLMS